MAIVGTDPVARCTPEEWKELLGMVRHGMLFEVIEWLDAGKPSLRPERKFTSAIESAILIPNLSMPQILWERTWQGECGSIDLHDCGPSCFTSSASVSRNPAEDLEQLGHEVGHDSRSRQGENPCPDDALDE